MEGVYNVKQYEHFSGLENQVKIKKSRNSNSKVNALVTVGVVFYIFVSTMLMFNIIFINNQSYALIYSVSQQMSELARFNAGIFPENYCPKCSCNETSPMDPGTSIITSAGTTPTISKDNLTTSIVNNNSSFSPTEITIVQSTIYSSSIDANYDKTENTETPIATEDVETTTAEPSTKVLVSSTLFSTDSPSTSDSNRTTTKPPMLRKAWEVLYDAAAFLNRTLEFNCIKICSSIETIEASLTIFRGPNGTSPLKYRTFLNANGVGKEFDLAKSKVAYLALIGERRLHKDFLNQVIIEQWDVPTQGCSDDLVPTFENKPDCNK